MAHMHADLVRAPGIQPELYKGQPAAVKKRLKMRYGRQLLTVIKEIVCSLRAIGALIVPFIGTLPAAIA